MKNKIFIIILYVINGLCVIGQINSQLSDFIPPYALPITRIKVKIIVEKTYLYKGPYKDYAEKYLSINDVIEKDNIIYNFKFISLSTHNEPDITTYNPYFQKANKKLINLFNLLKENGYIIIPNSEEINKYINIKTHLNNYDTPINKSLSVKRNIIKEKQIKEKKIKKDTLFITIPEEHELLKIKDIETKAEEAANFIIKIRKRLFKTITGQENTPQGEAMVHAINTLKDLEKQYLALFKGEKIITYDTLNFELVVDNNNLNKPINLFNFSTTALTFDHINYDNTGIISITIKDFLNSYSNMEVNIKNSKIKYRLPEKVLIEIKKGDTKIFQTETFVFISRK